MAGEAKSEAGTGTDAIVVKPRILWTQWGEHAREILHQYNEAGYNSCASLTFRGPHYVTQTKGEFFLRPFGAWTKYRHSFECRPEFIPGEPEPIWTFIVL
jgi:hypothetical protein